MIAFGFIAIWAMTMKRKRKTERVTAYRTLRNGPTIEKEVVHTVPKEMEFGDNTRAPYMSMADARLSYQVFSVPVTAQKP